MDIEKVIEEAERLQSLQCEGDSRDRLRTQDKLRALFGLDNEDNNDPPYTIPVQETLECVLPKSYGHPANGNQIILGSVLDGNLWFCNACTEGYGHGYKGCLSVFNPVFRSRTEALEGAVREFRGQLGKFRQNTPREKKLVHALQKWLDKIEAENVPQKTQMEDTKDKALLPFPPAREGEQLRLGSREDGFVVPEDLETERQKKIRSELEAVTATRKQMGMLQKAYNRQALYLSIVSVIEEARSRSAGSPGERILAADVQGRMRVLTEETARDFEGCHRVVYAAFLDGAEVDYKEREGRKDDA